MPLPENATLEDAVSINRHRKIWSSLATVTALAAVASACGSSGTSSNGGGTASGSAKSQAAAAQKRVEAYMRTPTEINQKVPLDGKIPTDKPWVIVSCELPGCRQITDGAVAAGKAAGVPTKVLTYMSTDETTYAAEMKKALTLDPIAVSPIGGSQSPWNSLQDEYRSAHVFITPIVIGNTEPNDVVTEGSGSQVQYSRTGGEMADYVIADSGAKAKILLQDVPAFSSLKAYTDGFEKQLSKACSDCKFTSLDLTPTQVASNSVVSAIVAALQKDRSIEYLVTSDGAFLVGISSALKAAGLSNVKVVGGLPDYANLTELKSGQSTAWTGQAQDQLGWVALDIVGRKALGMEIPPADGGAVTQILTKENIGTPSETGLGVPHNYQDQFLKLWGLS
ncbi:sugar ABC transporter substrate-binding protein [Streptomyces sp. NPDC058321]|uniref:sugar ABC transporter substrate-binding protein n=1 Tax=Streptomyces sp. NPDC058321 TaxID=3346445 RepID=UPI0036E8704B